MIHLFYHTYTITITITDTKRPTHGRAFLHWCISTDVHPIFVSSSVAQDSLFLLTDIFATLPSFSYIPTRTYNRSRPLNTIQIYHQPKNESVNGFKLMNGMDESKSIFNWFWNYSIHYACPACIWSKLTTENFTLTPYIFIPMSHMYLYVYIFLGRMNNYI